jgi:hypothetical protein
MSNLGVFLIYGAGMILTGILIAACKPCTAGKNTRLSKVITKLRKVFIWNGFFRFIIQGSLKMQLACGTIIAIYFDQANKPIQSAEDVLKPQDLIGPGIVLLIFNVMPVVFSLLLFCSNENLDSDAGRDKYGTLYATVDINKRGSGSYIVVYLLRRSFFVLVTFVFYDYPGF